MSMTKKRLLKLVNNSFEKIEMGKFTDIHQRKLCEDRSMMIEIGNGNADISLRSSKKLEFIRKNHTIVGIEEMFKIVDFLCSLDVHDVILEFLYDRKRGVEGIIAISGICRIDKDEIPIKIWLAPRDATRDRQGMVDLCKKIKELHDGKNNRHLRERLARVKRKRLIEAL